MSSEKLTELAEGERLNVEGQLQSKSLPPIPSQDTGSSFVVLVKRANEKVIRGEALTKPARPSQSMGGDWRGSDDDQVQEASASVVAASPTAGAFRALTGSPSPTTPTSGERRTSADRGILKKSQAGPYDASHTVSPTPDDAAEPSMRALMDQKIRKEGDGIKLHMRPSGGTGAQVSDQHPTVHEFTKGQSKDSVARQQEQQE